MTIQLDKICRTCMAESMTLTSIWSCDKSFLHSATNIDCSSDAPALALMLSSLMSSNVSIPLFGLSKFHLLLERISNRSQLMTNYQIKCA